MKVMPDHVHLFVSIPVTLSISNVVRQLKGYSSLGLGLGLGLGFISQATSEDAVP